MHGAVCRIVVLHEGAAGGLLELGGEPPVLELERQRLAEDAALLGVPRVDEVLLDLANYDPTLTEEIFCFEHAAKERPQVHGSRCSNMVVVEESECRRARHCCSTMPVICAQQRPRVKEVGALVPGEQVVGHGGALVALLITKHG